MNIKFIFRNVIKFIITLIIVFILFVVVLFIGIAFDKIIDKYVSPKIEKVMDKDE